MAAGTDAYEVLVGINYPDPSDADTEKRALPGDIVTDLPEKSAKWLLRDGHIRKAKAKPTTKPAAKPTTKKSSDTGSDD